MRKSRAERKLFSFLFAWLVLSSLPSKATAEISESFAHRLLDDPTAEVIRLSEELKGFDASLQPKEFVQRVIQINLARRELEDLWQSTAEIEEQLRLALNLALQEGSVEDQLYLKVLLVDLQSWNDEADPVEIKRSFEEILKDPDLAKYPSLRTLILISFARFYTRISENERGLPLRIEAMNLIDSQIPINAYMKMVVLEAVASGLYEEDKIEQALVIDLRQYQTCKKERWRRFCALNAQNIALSYASGSLQGQTSKAKPFLEESRRYAEDLKNQILLADVYYAYLKYYNALGSYEEALVYGRKAEEIYKKFQVADGLRFTYQRLAQATEALGQDQKALEYAAKAIDEKGPDNEILRQTYLLQIRVYKKLAQTRELLVAYENFTQFLEEQEEVRAKTDYKRMLVNLGLKSDEEKANALAHELQLQKQKQQTILLVSALLLVLLMLAASYLLMSRRMFNQQRKLSAILREVKLGILALDPQLKAYGEYSSFFNQILGSIKGFQRDKPLEALAEHVKERDTIHSLIESLKAGFGLSIEEWKERFAQLPQELTLERPEHFRYLAVDWQPIPNRNNRVRLVLLLIRDETEQKQLQMSVNLQNEQLLNLGLMTASIAHDIASPSGLISMGQKELDDLLREITAVLDQAFSGADDPDAQTLWGFLQKKLSLTYLVNEQIKVAITRIIAVQSAVRNQSRLEQTPVPFLLRELMEESFTLAHSSVKRLRVNIECSPTLKVLGMRSQLGQVLTNLLNNAGDAVQENPHAQQKPSDIILRAEQLGERILISVEDSGQGIKPEVKARLFQGFFTTKGVGRGTGLGLPICKKIIEQHQGTLELGDSPQLGGAAMRINLPT